MIYGLGEEKCWSRRKNTTPAGSLRCVDVSWGGHSNGQGHRRWRLVNCCCFQEESGIGRLGCRCRGRWEQWRWRRAKPAPRFSPSSLSWCGRIISDASGVTAVPFEVELEEVEERTNWAQRARPTSKGLWQKNRKQKLPSEANTEQNGDSYQRI